MEELHVEDNSADVSRSNILNAHRAPPVSTFLSFVLKRKTMTHRRVLVERERSMMFVIEDVCDPRTHQRWDLYEPARVPCQKYRLAGKAGHETSVSDPAIRLIMCLLFCIFILHFSKFAILYIYLYLVRKTLWQTRAIYRMPSRDRS